MAEKDKRRRQAAFVFVEMMLRDPGGIVTEPFGVGDLLGRQTIALCGGRGIEQAGEKGETLETRAGWHRRSYGRERTGFNGCRDSSQTILADGRWRHAHSD